MASDPILRDRLIECALAMVDRHDTDISLRAVARAAGVSAMAPYRHFADKAALLRSVTNAGFERLRGDLTYADMSEDRPRDALIAQGLAYVAFARAHPELFRLMFTDPRGVVQGAGCEADAFAVLNARVATLRPHTPDVAAIAAWSIVHGLATLLLDRRLIAEEATIRTLLTQFADGLTAGVAP